MTTLQHAARVGLADGRRRGPAGMGAPPHRDQLRRRPPLYPPGREDRIRHVARRACSRGSIIRSIRSGSRRCTACWAARARPPGNAPPSCFASPAPSLLVIPIYLLSLELFGEQTAWLACVLAIANPIIGYVVVNVLSESTFLLWWSFRALGRGPVSARRAVSAGSRWRSGLGRWPT